MNKYQRACQLWPLLAWAASKSQIMLYYEEVGGLVGIHWRNKQLNDALELIDLYCKKKKLPRLNAIVVNGRTGRPGKGIPQKRGRKLDGQRLDREQVAIKDYGNQWLKKSLAPNLSDFEKFP